MDTAPHAHGYVAGMVTESSHSRVWHAPLWIRNQRAAELFGPEQVIKLAACEKSAHAWLVGDNPAALLQVVQGKARVRAPAQQRLLSRITHCLRWSGL